MAIEVYINFNGNCREAVEFYAQALKTEPPVMMTFGDAPPNPEHPIPEEAKSLIMHARLNIAGSRVMFSDVFPGMSFVQGNNISIAYLSNDIDEVKSAFHNMKEGGRVSMELQETFWSKCYGIVVDKFGIEWQFNYDNGEFTM